MPMDVTKLRPEMKKKLAELLKNCRAKGIEMRASDGLRTPLEQARLWRQSRSSEQISAKIKELQDAGAVYLAGVLSAIGRQSGPDVTGAIPGYSWHQWGEAVDCFWLVDGKAEWSLTRKVGGLNGYVVYANEAEKLGLTAGGHWPRRKDWPHVQLRSANGPGDAMTLLQIDAEMQKRFG